MSFQPKLQDFKKVFRFFIDEYGYSLVYEDDPHFMGCMYLRYEKDGAPTIRIETEKFIIDEQIKI